MKYQLQTTTDRPHPGPVMIRSDGGEELEDGGLGLGVHADDDDEGDEAVVRHHLRLLHRPRGPLLHEPHRGRRRGGVLVVSGGLLPALALGLRLQRRTRRHGGSPELDPTSREQNPREAEAEADCIGLLVLILANYPINNANSNGAPSRPQVCPPKSSALGEFLNTDSSI